MKKLFLLSIIAFATAANAQKIQKTDCGKVEVEIPPLDMAIQEFDKIHVKNDNQTAYNFDKSFNGFRLPGFTQTKDGGHVIVGFQVMPFEVETVEISKVEREKEVDGVKTKYYTYQGTAACHWRVVASLLKSNGDEYMSEEYGASGTVATGLESSHDAASKAFDKAKVKFIQDRVSESVNKFNTAVKDKYCFVNTSKKVTVVTIKPKKYDYDNVNMAADYIKECVVAFNVNKTTTADIKSKCTEAISIWKTELAESDLEDKKARINKGITAALYYNMGVAYFLMEDFKEAEANLRKAYDIGKNVTGIHQQWINISKKMKLRIGNKRV